ncbi:hypothetical protein GCM10025867_49280 (plasmid) [Frondihabitans sucicola]|uniref:Uncharacterized protein n=1 Tax=Frondihabitans sucicola TaxID=1268041 RepID=A0ABN6Y5S3_9MICO|nr:hypothetical protein [Frondihabitans sucicola]BDZ52687.1 hypothetical protein GCM10025867_49280 [Frondihabitans sucicola]
MNMATMLRTSDVIHTRGVSRILNHAASKLPMPWALSYADDKRHAVTIFKASAAEAVDVIESGLRGLGIGVDDLGVAGVQALSLLQEINDGYDQRNGLSAYEHAIRATAQLAEADRRATEALGDALESVLGDE